MAKRFYKVDEMVWIQPLKKKGKITKLDIPNLKCELTYFESKEVLITAEFPFTEIDKLRSKDEDATVTGNNLTTKKDTILFAKVRANGQIPTKRLEDGCYDIYAAPQNEEQPIIIRPHEIVDIPTGIASSFLPKYRIDVKRERGSTGSIGLVPRGGQIDSGYRGEWFLKIQNTTDKIIVITNLVKTTITYHDRVEYPLTKAICQAAVEIVPDLAIKEIPYDILTKIPSERGMGKYGSSGK